jgi:hypothetical protein
MRAVKPVKLETPFKIVAVHVAAAHALDRELPLLRALAPLGIPLQAFEGVYWAQCLERGFDKLIADGVDAILTIDYDTVYTAAARADADAADAAASRSRRDLPDAVGARLGFGSRDRRDAGRNDCRRMCRARLFDADLLKLKTGHFGLTLIRASSLKSVPKPWFLGVPAKDGSWGEGHVDEDIYFWRQWAERKDALRREPRRRRPHRADDQVAGRDLGVIHQRVADYWNEGVPKEVWK